MTNIPEKIKSITNDRLLFNLSKIKRTTKSLVMLTELRVLVNFICGALRYLVPFVQFKKRETHPWRSANRLLPATSLKLTLLHGCVSRFLNCANGTKSLNAQYLQKFFLVLQN